ncbi:hypothetical protein [Rhodoferax ferrireducens]|uniref:hypothetical protein n=1 Tax=Rhodoferax ferrireducens TaxID=192843 RepID=UPI0013008DF3|nr:hypothetical protein [Rhodoferax ferrireducens]
MRNTIPLAYTAVPTGVTKKHRSRSSESPVTLDRNTHFGDVQDCGDALMREMGLEFETQNVFDLAHSDPSLVLSGLNDAQDFLQGAGVPDVA